MSTGHIATLNGQGSINAQRPYLGKVLPGTGLLTPNTSPARGLGAMPATNTLARNVALTRNGLTNVAKGNLANANSNVVIPNFANKLASANVASANSGANIAKPNLAKAANFMNSGFGNQLLSANNGNPSHPGSIASSKALSKYQLSSPYPQNYGNYPKKNTASNLAGANLANKGWYPNMPIGSSYSQSVLNGALDNQEYGIYVQADGLEIAGNVAVTGSMPLYGTVSLNGKLPTEGSATVNYACSG